MSEVTLYRGSSKLRTHTTPRVTIGPWKVQGYLAHDVRGFWKRLLISLKKWNFSKNGCLFLKKLRNFSKKDCLFLHLFSVAPAVWCGFRPQTKKILKKQGKSKNGCSFLQEIRNFWKNGCLFLKKTRNKSLQKRLFLIRTVSCERGTPVGSWGLAFLMSEVPL